MAVYLCYYSVQLQVGIQTGYKDSVQEICLACVLLKGGKNNVGVNT